MEAPKVKKRVFQEGREGGVEGSEKIKEMLKIYRQNKGNAKRTRNVCKSMLKHKVNVTVEIYGGRLKGLSYRWINKIKK